MSKGRATICSMRSCRYKYDKKDEVYKCVWCGDEITEEEYGKQSGKNDKPFR